MLWALWTGVPSSFIAIGARDSYKTLTLAASETLDIIHRGCGVVHIGAIESQALKCYAYVKKNLESFKFLWVRPPLMSRTELTTGGRLEILPCTINRVNSPHEPKVRFDEVELADPLAYNEAKFIAASDEKGNDASMCYTTTRKFAYGLAQQEVEAAVAAGRRVFIWCYKDISEPCPDSRSGTSPATIYANRNTLKWSMKREAEDMVPYQVFDKCLSCSLVPSCRGDLKRATGIKPIKDLILKMDNSSADYWLSQMDCLRPSRKGLMIGNFTTDANCKRLNWDMFLNASGRLNTDRYRYVWGKDWGWNPDATILCILDKTRDILYAVKEFSFVGKTTPYIARELHRACKELPFGYPEDIQCDKAEPGLIETFRQSGFYMAQPAETDIEGGCDLLNDLAMPINSSPQLFVDPVMCPTLVWELTVGYIRKTDRKTNEPGEEPRDKHNHFVDSLRYVAWKYLRKYLRASACYSGIGGGTMDFSEHSSLSSDADTMLNDAGLSSAAYLMLDDE